MAAAREASCFGGPKSTFRGRCRASALFFCDVQISWQAQHLFRHLGISSLSIFESPSASKGQSAECRVRRLYYLPAVVVQLAHKAYLNSEFKSSGSGL